MEEESEADPVGIATIRKAKHTTGRFDAECVQRRLKTAAAMIETVDLETSGTNIVRLKSLRRFCSRRLRRRTLHEWDNQRKKMSLRKSKTLGCNRMELQLEEQGRGHPPHMLACGCMPNKLRERGRNAGRN
jgi:hypothetical protein